MASSYSFPTFSLDLRVNIDNPMLTCQVDGGSAKKEFLYVHKHYRHMEAKYAASRSPWYCSIFSGWGIREEGRLYKDDIVLEVEGRNVAGLCPRQFKAILSVVCRDKSVISLTCIAAGTISTSLVTFLALPCLIASPDNRLQHRIRENVCSIKRPLNTPFTTRPQEKNEVEGRDYVFITPDEFERMKNFGHLLEFQHFNGHYYGTPWPLGEIEEDITVKEANEVFAANRNLSELSLTKAMDQNCAQNDSTDSTDKTSMILTKHRVARTSSLTNYF